MVVVPTVVGLAHRRAVKQAALSPGNTQSRRDLTIETTGGHEMICAQLTALPEPSGTQSSSRFSRWYFSAALTHANHPDHRQPFAQLHELATQRTKNHEHGKESPATIHSCKTES